MTVQAVTYHFRRDMLPIFILSLPHAFQVCHLFPGSSAKNGFSPDGQYHAIPAYIRLLPLFPALSHLQERMKTYCVSLSKFVYITKITNPFSLCDLSVHVFGK